MEDFIYENASKIIFGKHDESIIATEIKSLGAKKVLIHYGQGSIIRSGLLGRITRALRTAGIRYIEYGGVVANPLRSHTFKGIEIAKEKKVDFILAVGGGSVIDSAKCIAAGLVNNNIWSFYQDKTKSIKNAVPFGVVLTIPAAGSECSPNSVIKDEVTGLKYGLSSNCLRSKFAFINPEYCASLPKEQVAYGASDILAHLMERYFSPCQDVILTDKILSASIQSMFEIAPKVYKDPADFQSMAEFCLLGTLAHNGMLALGRMPQAWEAHPIENAVLSGSQDIAHGAGLAIIFPAWLKYMAETKPTKVLQFAREAMCASGKNDTEIIANGIKKLEAFYKSLDLAITLSEMNINPEMIKKIARIAFSQTTELGGYGRLTVTDIENIIDLAR